MMSEEKLRQELCESFKNRAMMYYHIFEELSKEIGEEKATEIMRRGIYNRGQELGEKFAKYAPADLEGLKNAFLASTADQGRMFKPELIHCGAGRLEIRMRSCPLKDVWQETGLSNWEIARMCHIAAAVDEGVFEGAGFRFSAETWRPGREGCCLLQIRPGSQPSVHSEIAEFP